MYKYLLAAFCATPTEAQSRTRSTRSRDFRRSRTTALAKTGNSQYAEAIYVGLKPYGANRTNAPAKENQDLEATIVAEAVDTADGTPITDSEVYALFQHAAADSPSLTVNILKVHDFKQWRCTWTQVSQNGTGTATKQASQRNGEAAVKITATGMDIKTGEGRQAFRGTSWKRQGGAPSTTSESWVVEVQSDSVVASGVQRIGCGRFRRHAAEGFIKDVIDKIRVAGLNENAQTTTRITVLQANQDNTDIPITNEAPATPPTQVISIGGGVAGPGPICCTF